MVRERAAALTVVLARAPAVRRAIAIGLGVGQFICGNSAVAVSVDGGKESLQRPATLFGLLPRDAAVAINIHPREVLRFFMLPKRLFFLVAQAPIFIAIKFRQQLG